MRDVILFSLMLVSVDAVASSVRGRVVHQSAVLPGVTITTGGRTVVSDADGRFHVDDLRPGEHEFVFELTGLTTTRLLVQVTDAPATLRDVHLRSATPFCGVVTRACAAQPALSRYDPPLCTDRDVVSEFAQRLPHDREAALFLRRRLGEERSIFERFRIAALLLRHLEDERAITLMRSLLTPLTAAVAVSGVAARRAFNDEMLQRQLDPEREFILALWSIEVLSESRLLTEHELSVLAGADDVEVLKAVLLARAAQGDRTVLAWVAQLKKREDFADLHESARRAVFMFYDETTHDFAREINNGIDPDPEEVAAIQKQDEPQ